VLLWLQSSSSSSIGRRPFSLARHFLTFSWKEGARAGCLQWRTHFHCFLPSVITSQAGVGAQTEWLLTAHDRHCHVCPGDRARGQEKGLARTYRPDERPVTAGLSLLWRRRPLSGLLLLSSWQEPKQTLVSFVLGKSRLNIVDDSIWANWHSYTVKQIQAQYQKPLLTDLLWCLTWRTMLLWSLREAFVLCALQNPHSITTAQCLFHWQDLTSAIHWMYYESMEGLYGSTCRLFLFHFCCCCCCLFIFCQIKVFTCVATNRTACFFYSVFYKDVSS